VHANVARTAAGLRRLGFAVHPAAAIIPLLVPAWMDVRNAARGFHDRGIFVNAVEYPAVPISQQRFRISLMADHTAEDIDRLLTAVQEVWAQAATEARPAIKPSDTIVEINGKPVSKRPMTAAGADKDATDYDYADIYHQLALHPDKELKLVVERAIPANNGKQADHFRSLQAATAWYCGRYSEAKALLDGVGSRVHTDVFRGFFNVPYDTAVGEIYALGGADSSSFARAARLQQQGKYSDALAIYQSILRKNKNDKRLTPYINARISETKAKQKQGSGG
jgi:tetratricopeptide (TPR) repeat protein